MKTEIVTFVRAYNYGAVLQCFALSRYLSKQGVDVEVIMKPLSFKDFDNDANVPERTESTNVDNNDSNNIEEEKKVEE